MTYTFEGDDIVYIKDIRRKMVEILDMPKGGPRTKRARAFANGYRAVDENAVGNMGQAASYLGERYAEARDLFGFEHPVFGEEDPRDAAERLLDEDPQPESLPEQA